MRMMICFTIVLFLLIISTHGLEKENPFLFQKNSELQLKVDASGAEWSIGNSRITQLSEDEFCSMLGYFDDSYPLDNPQTEQIEMIHSAILPSTYSLKQYMTSVKNQGSCGSWVYAVSDAFEGCLRKADGIYYNLSKQFLISTCFEGGDCTSVIPVGIGPFVVNTGVVESSCFPMGAGNDCSNACSNWQDIAIKATDFYKVNQSVNSIKSAIYSYGPVWLAFKVYSDFRYYHGGIYKHAFGIYQGSRFVVAVGWNDDQEYFIVKNSWGNSWGESGYFRISYSEVNSSTSFGMHGMVFEK